MNNYLMNNYQVQQFKNNFSALYSACDTVAALNRLDNNINQAIKLCNSGLISPSEATEYVRNGGSL